MKRKLIDVTAYVFKGNIAKQIKPNLNKNKMNCETCEHISESGITCTLQNFEKQGWGHCYAQKSTLNNRSNMLN